MLSRFIILITLFSNLLISAQETKFEFEKKLEIKQKVAGVGDISNIFIDEFFNYYVIDMDSKKILVFNTSGELVKKIPNDNSAQLFDKPTDISVLKDGKILVLDKGAKKVITLNNDGEKLNTFGFSGSKLGFMDEPIQMELDVYGNIYVLDIGNKTLIKFNSQGLYRGAINVSEPISFSVGLDLKLHVLEKAADGFIIKKYSPQFSLVSTIPIRGLKEPNDMVINRFNEYYLVDLEQGSVFQFDSTGKPNNIKLGIKGNSGNNGTFTEPTKLSYQYVNDNNDKVYILDKKFQVVQSFNVSFATPRTKPITPLIKLDIQFVEKVKTNPYEYFTISNNVFYYILADYTLLAMRGSEEVFRITKQVAKQKNINLSEPVALAVYNNKLYVVDQDEDCVVVLDATSGDYLNKFGESGSNDGQLKSPNGIVIDKSGKVYVSDYKNNRINIYNEQGMYINRIMVSSSPIKISVNLKGDLYILVDTKKSIFFVEKDKNKIETLPMNGLLLDYELSNIATIDEDILLAYDEDYGVIHVFDKNKKVSEFLSKGDLEKVDFVVVDNVQNTIYVSNKKINFTNTYKLLIPPLTPTNFRLKVDDSGNAELTWEGQDQRVAYYRVYRKKADDKDYQLFLKVDKTQVLLDKPSEFVYLYAIVAVSKDELVSGFTNNVEDEFSYLLFLKDYQPQNAIKKLETLKNLNPSGVVNRISLIYRDLILKYRTEKNFEMVINTLNEIVKIKPEDVDSYLELANAYKTLLKFSDGIRVLSDAKNRFPDNLNIYLNLIRLTSLNKEYSNTINTCREALVRFPDNEKILESLAEAYIDNNQKEEAIQIYKGLTLKTGKESHYISSGKLLLSAGRIDEAINLYTQAQNTNVAGPELNAALAEAFVEKGKYADAIIQIEKSISADPKTAKYFYILGLAHSRNRNKVVAIKSFEEAIKLDSTQADFYLALGKDLEITNKTPDATKAYEKAYALAPNNPDVLFSLGKVYLDQKKYDYSCRLLKDANKLLPENIEIKTVYDKALVTREKFNAKRDPIEIDKISLDNLFPSLFNYYQNQPIGTLTLFNTKTEAFEDIKVEITAPDLTDEPYVTTIPLMLPNDFKDILVYLKLKESLIKKSMEGTKEYNVTFTISYVKKDPKDINKDKQIQFNEKRTIKVYSLNSISWEDKKRLASFISPIDESIRNFTTANIIAKLSDITLANPGLPKPVLQAMQIWEYLRSLNVTYVQDPNMSYQSVSESNVIDYVQFATQTLERRSGDCDDLVTLLCTIFESIGIHTAVIDVPGHVFLAFDAGISADKLMETGINESNLIIRNGKVWVPLEATVLGKNYFNESWEVAIKRYLETLKNNQRLELIEHSNASVTYPPINYPGGSMGVNIIPDYEAIKYRVNENIAKFKQATTQNIEAELLQVLNKYPKNIYVANKLGRYYARNKKYSQAEIQFLNVIVEDKFNLVALINLGNVYYIQKNFDKAESYYGRAILIDENNVGLLINMARLYLAMGKQVKAKEYFSKADKINPEVTKQYTELIKRFN